MELDEDLLIPFRKPYCIGEQPDPEEFPEIVPREFAVITADRYGQHHQRSVWAETNRLALGAVHALFRHESPIAVEGVTMLGRCLRCRAILLDGDWHQRRTNGLVCEDCPLGVAVHFPVKRKRRCR